MDLASGGAALASGCVHRVWKGSVLNWVLISSLKLIESSSCSVELWEHCSSGYSGILPQPNRERKLQGISSLGIS